MEQKVAGGPPIDDLARNFMHTYDSNKSSAAELTQETANRLQRKETTLIAVIESLGDYITDEDATIRSKALHYLAGVLENLPKSFLSRQQLDVICTYLLERIQDVGAAGGLLALQYSTRFTKDMAVMTTRAVLEELQDLQVRPSKERYVIIRLIHDLLANHREPLKTMGEEFLAGVIDLFSGEKDPRNLMLIFSVIVVVATEWDLGTHVEPLFDSVFCYYPITFRPPENDPYKITAQDLKQRLRQCVAASSQFAEFAFPQLLEKLDSGSPNMKRDVFDTLKACVDAYYPRVVAEYSIKLWDALRHEIFYAQEEDLADEALSVIQAITTKLYSNAVKHIHDVDPRQKYINAINKECLDKLKEPQQKQGKAASRILAAVAISNHRVLDEVVKAVFPTLLSLYEGDETIEGRRSLLETFLVILEAASTTSEAQSRLRTEENPLSKFKDTLLEKFSQALMATVAEEMSYRILALECLAKLSNIPGVLLDMEVGLPIQYFNEIILTEDGNGRLDLMNKAIDTLLELSASRYQVLLDITVPKLLAELPDHGSSDVDRYQRSIGILARLSTKRELSEIITRRLFGRLESALTYSAPAEYCEALLVALNYSMKSQEQPNTSITPMVVQRIMDLTKASGNVATIDTSKDSQPPLGNISVLKALGRLICLVVRNADPAIHTEFAQNAYTLFTGELINGVRIDSTIARRKTTILSTSILAAINASSDNLPADLEDPVALMNATNKSILENESPEIQQVLLQHSCLLVNKFGKEATLNEAQTICLGIGGQESSPSTRTSQANLLMYLSRALILRMSSTRLILNHLLALLASEEWGPLIAPRFDILLAKDEIMTKENGAKIRLLAGQAVFTQVLEYIGTIFQTAAAEVRPRYLIALGGILRNVDSKLALTLMKELNPLLLQSLKIQDGKLKSATISILATAITQSSESVSEHLSSIIAQLLHVAIERKSNDASLRLLAMSCLGLVPGNYKEFELLPHSKVVDRGIVKVLDDPRRNVRKAAVDCRTAWLALDEPNEDD